MSFPKASDGGPGGDVGEKTEPQARWQAGLATDESVDAVTEAFGCGRAVRQWMPRGAKPQAAVVGIQFVASMVSPVSPYEFLATPFPSRCFP